VKLSAFSAFSAFSAVIFLASPKRSDVGRTFFFLRGAPSFVSMPGNFTAENAEKAETAESFTTGCGSNVEIPIGNRWSVDVGSEFEPLKFDADKNRPAS